MKKEGKKLYNISFGTILSMALIMTSLNLVWADDPDHSVRFTSEDIVADDDGSISILKTGDEDTSSYKKIKTIADLYAINSGLDDKYILMNDIDMSSTDGGDYDIDGEGWEPISTFKGVFDGNGHKLSNLSIRCDKYDYVGLFGRIEGAEIRNLCMENVTIRAKKYDHGNGAISVGSIAGDIKESIVENCYVTGTIQEIEPPTLSSGSRYFGGIVGSGVDKIIRNCYSSVEILSNTGGESDAGGICGYFGWGSDDTGGLMNCYSLKSVNTLDTYGDGHTNMITTWRSDNCYYLLVPGEDRSDSYAKGLSNGMMKTASSFVGFDFEKVWYIDSHAPNTNYPQLRSCPQDRIASVVIEKNPDKLEYLTTDKKIDLTGGTLKITYEDGTVAAGVSMDEANVYYDLLPAGKQTVTVDYGGKTATFEITVKKKTPTIEGELEFEKKVDDVFKLELNTDSDGVFVFKYEPEEGAEKIVRISDGYVECLKSGEAIIEASLPETDTYEAISEEITVTIKEKDGSGGNDDDDDDEEESKDGVKRYKVTFDSNGGSSVPNQKVEEGDYIDEPSAPAKEGFIFDGWYTEKEFKNKWNFSSNLVYSKMTLYAKWVTFLQKAKEDSVIFNGDVVSYNGVRYYLSGTKVNGTELFNNAGSVYSSDNSIAKVNKKGVITFKKDGKTTITADTGESMDIIIFGKKPVSASVRVGDVYAIPDEIMIETLGDLRYSNASKVTVSDDGKLTALASGTVKVKYTQSGKTKVVLKLKIKK